MISRPTLLLRATAEGRTVALGVFVSRRTRRHVVMRPRQLYLHETGDSAIDRITIEHNGLLVARDAPTGTETAIFAHLRTRVPGWDECVLGGVPASLVEAARAAGLTIETDRQSPSFAIDLENLRVRGETMLDRLSRNTRAQLQRALRRAGAGAPLTLDAAADVGEALAFFDAMKTCHEERWRQRGQGGAFATPWLIAFHHRLIAQGVPSGAVEILRGRAGETVLGYLYNFVHRGRVCNYQGGFAPASDNRERPGLVMHYLCAERAKNAGMDVYDLLAGDTRYKRSIAAEAQTLHWCRAQQPRAALAAERWARRLKQKLFAR
jgi:CelD/BcsL family acetyltransferase involved in cellulose biosynthesis